MASPFVVLENALIYLDAFTGNVVTNPATGNPEPERIPLEIRAYLKAVRLAPETLLQPGINGALSLYQGYAIEPKILPDSVKHNSVGKVVIKQTFKLDDGSPQTNYLEGSFKLFRSAPKYADQFTGSPISGELIAKAL